jgi:hypothetical protein
LEATYVRLPQDIVNSLKINCLHLFILRKK